MLIAASVTNMAGVSGNIHDEHMADSPVRPQPAHLCGHGPHDFVGMQAALHEHFASPGGTIFMPLAAAAASVGAVSTIS